MAARKLDLEKLSLDELKALEKEVEKAISEYEKRARSEAMKEIQAIAKKHGLSVDEIVTGKGKGRKSKSVAKYQNPQNPDEVWSGRGRQPGWYKAALASGMEPTALEI